MRSVFIAGNDNNGPHPRRWYMCSDPCRVAGVIGRCYHRHHDATRLGERVLAIALAGRPPQKQPTNPHPYCFLYNLGKQSSVGSVLGYAVNGKQRPCEGEIGHGLVRMGYSVGKTDTGQCLRCLSAREPTAGLQRNVPTTFRHSAVGFGCLRRPPGRWLLLWHGVSVAGYALSTRGAIGRRVC